MALGSSRKSKYDQFSIDDEDSSYESQHDAKRQRSDELDIEISTICSSKRSYDDFMGNSDEESYQLSKKICNIDLSNSHMTLSYDDDINRNTSHGYSSSGYISKEMLNDPVSLSPLELPSMNRFLHHLHLEKISRQHRDHSYVNALSSRLSSHSTSPGRGSRQNSRYSPPTSSNSARTLLYPHHIQQHHSIANPSNLNSYNIPSALTIYDLQQDPQYQDKLNRHRESYLHRSGEIQADDMS